MLEFRTYSIIWGTSISDRRKLTVHTDISISDPRNYRLGYRPVTCPSSCCSAAGMWYLNMAEQQTMYHNQRIAISWYVPR
jgi:hypothetical protein